jgi:hypothetical protein
MYFQDQVWLLFKLGGDVEDTHTGCKEGTNYRVVSTAQILVGSFDRLIVCIDGTMCV